MVFSSNVLALITVSSQFHGLSFAEWARWRERDGISASHFICQWQESMDETETAKESARKRSYYGGRSKWFLFSIARMWCDTRNTKIYAVCMPNADDLSSLSVTISFSQHLKYGEKKNRPQRMKWNLIMCVFVKLKPCNVCMCSVRLLFFAIWE